MNQNLLKDLNESFKTLFDNFNRKNGNEALKIKKINLHCIKSNYLSLQESDETSKKELSIIQKDLELLKSIELGDIPLNNSFTLFNLKQLQTRMNLFNEDFKLKTSNLFETNIVQILNEHRLIEMAKFFWNTENIHNDLIIEKTTGETCFFTLKNLNDFCSIFDFKNVFIEEFEALEILNFRKIFLRIDNIKQKTLLSDRTFFNGCKANVSLKHIGSFSFLNFDFTQKPQEIQNKQIKITKFKG